MQQFCNHILWYIHSVVGINLLLKNGVRNPPLVNPAGDVKGVQLNENI